MDCEMIQLELTAYHFAAIDAEKRQLVEEHLPGCDACLLDYLAIKRSVETASLVEAPSPLARARLRHAVALSVTHGWSWWERPLAIACAAAAVTAALFGVEVLRASPGSAPISARSLDSSPGP
jgi:hypothetical protein